MLAYKHFNMQNLQTYHFLSAFSEASALSACPVHCHTVLPLSPVCDPGLMLHAESFELWQGSIYSCDKPLSKHSTPDITPCKAEKTTQNKLSVYQRPGCAYLLEWPGGHWTNRGSLDATSSALLALYHRQCTTGSLPQAVHHWQFTTGSTALAVCHRQCNTCNILLAAYHWQHITSSVPLAVSHWQHTTGSALLVVYHQQYAQAVYHRQCHKELSATEWEHKL